MHARSGAPQQYCCRSRLVPQLRLQGWRTLAARARQRRRESAAGTSQEVPIPRPRRSDTAGVESCSGTHVSRVYADVVGRNGWLAGRILRSHPRLTLLSASSYAWIAVSLMFRLSASFAAVSRSTRYDVSSPRACSRRQGVGLRMTHAPLARQHTRLGGERHECRRRKRVHVRL